MTDLVDPDQIEQIVGAQRDPERHLGRVVMGPEDQQFTVFILHSQRCLDEYDHEDQIGDLRDCPYSLALDSLIQDAERSMVSIILDTPLMLSISEDGRLLFTRRSS